MFKSKCRAWSNYLLKRYFFFVFKSKCRAIDQEVIEARNSLLQKQLNSPGRQRSAPTGNRFSALKF